MASPVTAQSLLAQLTQLVTDTQALSTLANNEATTTTANLVTIQNAQVPGSIVLTQAQAVQVSAAIATADAAVQSAIAAVNNIATAITTAPGG